MEQNETILDEKKPLAPHCIILPYSSTIPEFRMYKQELDELKRKGVRKADLDNLQSLSKLTYEQMSKMFDVGPKYMTDPTSADFLVEDLAWAVIQLSVIYSIGYHVLSDWQTLNDWMATPNSFCDGETPIERTYHGGFKVVRELLQDMV